MGTDAQHSIKPAAEQGRAEFGEMSPAGADVEGDSGLEGGDDQGRRTAGLRDVLTGLQFKATVGVVALTIGVAVVTSVYLVRSSFEVLVRQQEELLSGMTVMLARAAGPLIQEGNGPALAALAAFAVEREPLAFVAFTDRHGRPLSREMDPEGRAIFERLGRPSEGGEPLQGVARRHPAEKGVRSSLGLTLPVTAPHREAGGDEGDRGELIGYIHTGMVLHRWSALLARKVDALVGTGVLLTVLAVPAGFLVVRKIVAPIEGLATVMNRFSRGEWGARSDVRRNDEIGHLAATFNAMADEHERTHERLLLLNEELERRVEERTAQLRELAIREPLTGLYNRRYFNEVLDRCLREATRYGHDLSCIMLDLDDFKLVNDRHGHHLGDAVLVQLSRVIQKEMRSTDVPARFGGDEFVILLPQTTAQQAQVLAERLVRAFREEMAARHTDLEVDISAGVASAGRARVARGEDLVRAADRALYRAKKAHSAVVADPSLSL